MMSTAARQAIEIKPDQLNEIAMFRGLPETQLRQLHGTLRVRRCAIGTPLLTHEQMAAGVYFILSGAVKIHVEQANGEDVIIAIAGPGESIGEISALEQTAPSASVVTLTASTLMWLDCDTFRHCLLTMPALGHNLARLLAVRLRLANEQIQALATHEIETRVARQLLAFAERFGQAIAQGQILIPLRLTQSDLADLVGATRESINKIIVSYKERGYLSVSRDHQWTIHNRQVLANRCA